MNTDGMGQFQFIDIPGLNLLAEDWGVLRVLVAP